MLHPMDVGATIGAGWQTFTRNAVALILGAILMAIGIICTLGIGSGAMIVGYNRMCLRAARGESVAPGDVFAGFSMFVPSLLLMIIGGVAVCIGSVLCFVPGLIIGFGIYWGSWIMADGEEDPMACLRRSWEYNMANIGPVLVFIIVNTVISSIGSSVAVGSLITTPVAMAMAAHAYLRAFGSSAVAETPSF